MRFAFYGRVSTEDQQDPAASRGWQLQRSCQLIEPLGGEVVAEYFDIGMSRSLPWKRRPESARLLDDLRDPARGFDAVVIGEPARAFYGGQFGLTFPVFTHYGVELWVPEVGGRVDPGSDAHELVMALYGGMSKGERQRIKIRVRSAMAQQAGEGRFLGGRPPYGYHLADAGQHPNPGKAADGKRLHRLELDTATAPIVARIFDEYIAGAGLFAIAAGLTRDGVPCPSAADPARNRHRSGIAWSKGAVRAILGNPRYTGREVWNRQRRDEVLLDVEDVAAGHQSRLRWNDPSEWVWSAETMHEPIIDPETFAEAQRRVGAGHHRSAVRKPRRTARPYVLRGLIHCGVCGHRMQGTQAHGSLRYRCRVPTEYGLANELLPHPKAVYVREDMILERLDEWLARAFDPENIDATCAAMAAAGAPDDTDAATLDAARRKLIDCDDRLGKYRRQIEAGTDPVLVGGWIAEVQGERLAAERTIASASHRGTPDAAALRSMIEGIDVVSMLAAANPAAKSEVYADLGIRLTYRPDRRVVSVEALAVNRVLQSVSEGRTAPDVHALLTGEFSLA